MLTPRSFLGLSAALFAFGSPASASQSSPQSTQPGPKIQAEEDPAQPSFWNGKQQSEVLYVDQEDTIWGRGEDYKASVDPEGFTFIPFLGSQAPQNYPIRFTLSEILFGEESLPIHNIGKIGREAHRMEIDRGAVLEWYDFSMGSVEQSFALDLPRADKELRIRMDVQTELALNSDGEGWTYTNELGGASYRKAIVFDAQGQSLEIPIHATAGSVELRVPASFLATAVAPIVVDPILATATILPSSLAEVESPVIAYDVTNNVFAVAVVETFSQSDDDLFVTRYHGTTGAFLQTGYVHTGVQDTNNPRMASDNASDTFLLSYMINNGAILNAHCHVFSATNVFLNGGVNLASSQTSTVIDHDIGGNSTASGRCKALICRESLDIFRITEIISIEIVPSAPFTGSVFAFGTFVLAGGTTNYRVHNPRISKSTGEAAHSEGRVIWRQTNPANGAPIIKGTRFDSLGSYFDYNVTYASPHPNASITSLDVSDGLVNVPGSVTGEPVSCLIWTQTFGGQHSLNALPLEGSHVGNPIAVERGQHLASFEFKAAVGTTDKHFVIAHYDRLFGLYRAVYSTLSYTSQGEMAVREQRQVLDVLTNQWREAQPGVASKYSAGDYTSDVVGVANQDLFGSSWRVKVNYISNPGDSALGVQYCFGNPNSTNRRSFMTVYGSADTFTAKTLHAEDMPLNQFGYFITSQGGSSEIFPPGSNGKLCIAGATIGRYNQTSEIRNTGSTGSFDLTINPAAMPTTTFPMQAVAGSEWTFQAWHRDGASSNFTNAVRVRFE